MLPTKDSSDDKHVIIPDERQLGYKGNAKGVSIPPRLLQHINATPGDTILLIPRTGKHGPYIAIWKKTQEEDGHARTQ